jgi:hypothetical protein
MPKALGEKKEKGKQRKKEKNGDELFLEEIFTQRYSKHWPVSSHFKLSAGLSVFSQNF